MLFPKPANKATTIGVSTRAVNGVVRLVMINAKKATTMIRPHQARDMGAPYP
jgi:hypothetical protein